jgi:hypothetical protein
LRGDCLLHRGLIEARGADQHRTGYR